MINRVKLKKLLEENKRKQTFNLEEFIVEQKQKWDDEKYYFDEKECRKIDKYISLLKNDKGTSRKIKGLKFQMEIICELLCVKDRLTNKRRFREAHINVARKNGKSFIVGIIMSYLFFHQPKIFGALFVITGNTTQQAKELFNTFVNFINGNKALKRRCKILQSTKTVIRKDNNNKLIVLANDGAGADSYADYVAALDEIHEYKSDEIYGKLKTGQGIWEDPLTLTITTASSGEDKFNLEMQLYSKCKALLEEGKTEGDSFYFKVYEADKECDVEDVEQWIKANPALGTFRIVTDILETAENLKYMPLQENMFRRMFLNQHVATNHIDNAINMELWSKCLRSEEEIMEAIQGCRCWGGLDLSSQHDITAFVLVFYNENLDKYIVIPYLFTAKDTAVEREKKDKNPYLRWIQDGVLIGTEGKYIRFNHVLSKMMDLQEQFGGIEKIGFDRYGATTIMNVLEDEFDVIPLAQGNITMTKFINAFEELLIDERLLILDNEVLNFMAQNCVATMDENMNVKYSKKKSAQRFKIDGIVAMLMALGLAIEENEGFTYSSSSLLEKLNNM